MEANHDDAPHSEETVTPDERNHEDEEDNDDDNEEEDDDDVFCFPYANEDNAGTGSLSPFAPDGCTPQVIRQLSPSLLWGGAKPPAPQLVLDLGCGNAHWLVHVVAAAAKRQGRVRGVGVERAADRLRDAQRHVQIAGLTQQITLLDLDFTSLRPQQQQQQDQQQEQDDEEEEKKKKKSALLQGILDECTVVLLYLTPTMFRRPAMRFIFQQLFCHGKRQPKQVLSYEFPIPPQSLPSNVTSSQHGPPPHVYLYQVEVPPTTTSSSPQPS